LILSVDTNHNKFGLDAIPTRSLFLAKLLMQWYPFNLIFTLKHSVSEICSFFWFAQKAYGILHMCSYVSGLRTVVKRILTDYESLQESFVIWLCVAGIVFT